MIVMKGIQYIIINFKIEDFPEFQLNIIISVKKTVFRLCLHSAGRTNGTFGTKVAL